jgi:sulfur carrier protein
MRLQINGEERELTEGLTLAVLLEQLGMKPDRVAVELNREIVRRELWPQTRLNRGDRLEIVQFVGGGSGKDQRREREKISF